MTTEERIRFRRVHHYTKELLSLLEELAKQEDDYDKSMIIKNHIKRVAGSLEWFKEDIKELTR